MTKRLIIVAVVLAMALAAAPQAAAATRYAGPTGDLGAICTNQASPCEIHHAVETVAQPGDEVVVLPGGYNLGLDELTVDKAIDLHGAGQARPLLVSTAAPYAVEVGADGAAIRDLAIRQFGSGVNGALRVPAMATADRLVVTSAGPSSDTACDLAAGALLRNSVCRDTEDHGIGVAVSGADTNITLRNVTAVAQGETGWGILAFPGGGAEVTINARNVIASGPEADVRSLAPGAGDTAVVALDHSNYATESEEGAGSATVSNPGSGANQTAAPQFADAGSGNFHQLAGSPTIDSGGTDPLLGPSDLDGEARNQGAAPDIGADEFPAPPPPGGVEDTSITLVVDADRKQKVKKLKVEVGCGNEACEAKLGGKAVAKKAKVRAKKKRRVSAARKGKKKFNARKKTLSIAAGETKTQRVKFKMHRKSIRKLRRVLKRKAFRKKTKAKLMVTATDAAGNAATERVKVRLKR